MVLNSLGLTVSSPSQLMRRAFFLQLLVLICLLQITPGCCEIFRCTPCNIGHIFRKEKKFIPLIKENDHYDRLLAFRNFLIQLSRSAFFDCEKCIPSRSLSITTMLRSPTTLLLCTKSEFQLFI